VELNDFLAPQYRANAQLHRRMLTAVIHDLTPDELNWQAGPGHHSIWHHVWHMFLSNDYYFAGCLGTQPVWEAGGWAARLDLGPMAPVFQYPGNAKEGMVPRFSISDVPDELVNDLKALPIDGYLEYVDDMLAQTGRSLGEFSEERLRQKVDLYGVNVPAYVVATDFSHVARHIGMIEGTRGLPRGPGTGTATI
jgi:DinB superfamily